MKKEPRRMVNWFLMAPKEQVEERGGEDSIYMLHSAWNIPRMLIYGRNQPRLRVNGCQINNFLYRSFVTQRNRMSAASVAERIGRSTSILEAMNQSLTGPEPAGERTSKLERVAWLA